MMTDEQQPKMDITPDSAPPCVPVFNCVIYVGPNPDGGVKARVANLEGLECTASDERAALGQLVKTFKQKLAESLANGQQPAWIEPPNAPDAQEQTRLIPVHL